MYAKTSLENKDDASIYSMGNINVAGSKNQDGNGEYTDKTGNVLNQSATIEADGSIGIYSDTLTNKMREYTFAQTVVSDTRYDQDVLQANDVYYKKYGSRNYYLIPVNPTHLEKSSTKLLSPIPHKYKWANAPSLWLLDEKVTETVVKPASSSGQILSGNNMKLRAGIINNDMSQMLASGTLDAVAGTVNNVAVGNTRTTTRQIVYADHPIDPMPDVHDGHSGDQIVGVEQTYFDPVFWGFAVLGKSYDTTTTEQLPGGQAGIIGGGQAVSITGTHINNITVTPGMVQTGTVTDMVSSGHTGSAGSGGSNSYNVNIQGNTAIAAKNVSAGDVQTVLPVATNKITAPVQQTIDSKITLPLNGMSKIHTEPTAHYLIETDSRFTSYRQFISSDYMLQKLNVDPAKTMKRLGDAFYEQKLVREQVTELTGRYTLTGYSSTEEQYKALLNNGASYAKEFNLQVGIALTAEQMAQLTSDMVWLVEKEVNGEKVLVPQVYLAKADSFDLKDSGALIVADDVKVKASGDVNNAGIIQANKSLQIAATNITNYGGTIDGGNFTKLDIGQDLSNFSGVIKGTQVGITTGRNFKNETVTFTNTLPFMTSTITGKIAEVNAGQNLSIQTGLDSSILGAKLTAGQDMNITTGRNFNIDSVKTQERQNVGSYLDDKVKNIVTSIQAGNNIALVTNGDTTLKGAQVNAGNALNLLAGGNVNVSAVKDETIHDQTVGIHNGWKRTRNDDETVIGTNLQGGGNVTVAAVKLGNNNVDDTNRGNVNISGSNINSQNGGVTIAANKNVTAQEVTEKHESLVKTHTESHGFFSSKTTDTLSYSLINQVKGSTVSGNTVDITTGKDLTVKGSSIVGTNDVNLTAGDNVNITTAQESSQSENYSYTKKSGIFSGGGFGIIIGSQSQKGDLTNQTVNQVASTVGSTSGNVNISASKNATITGSDIIGTKGVNVTAQNIDINAAANTSHTDQTNEFHQSGLSISVGNSTINTITSASSSINRSKDVQDSRLKDLYIYKAERDTQKAIGAIEKDGVKAVTTGAAISVSIGSSSSKSETVTEQISAQGSNLTSSGDIKLTATGSGTKDSNSKAVDGNQNIIGSTITGQNVNLTATKDINLQSAGNTNTSNTTSSGKSAGVGVQLGSAGFGVYVEGTKSSGRENENGTNHTETQVTANDTLNVKSGSDTNMIGSQAKGDSVKMEVGGNLNIASQQDSDNYTEKNSSVGGKIGTGNIGSSVSASKSNMDSNYSSVTEQSGIQAGKGGFDIQVGKNTDLKGAVIASTATPDKNKISTGTLTYSDIQNKADYNASSVGVDFKSGIITPTPGIPVSGKADSTTKSAVSPGIITITGNQKQDLSNLSRDPSGALNELGKIFDKKTVQEKQELVNLFSQEAVKLVGDIAEREKDRLTHKIATAKTNQEKEAAKNEYKLWMEGGTNKVLLHTFVGGLTGQLAGGDFMSGAAGAGFNEVLQGTLKNIKDPTLHQLASTLVGSAAAKIIGGDTKTGAITALNETKYNYLSHWQKEQRDAAVSNENWNDVAYYDRVNDVQEKTLNRFGISADFIDSSPEAQNILSKLTTNIMSLQDSGLDPFAVLESLDEAGQTFDNVKYGALIAAGIEFSSLKPLRGVGGKGWRGDKTWKSNVNNVSNGGTIEEINGTVATQQEAIDLINASGGEVIRIEEAHPEGGLSPHTYPHINYETSSGVKGAIRIQEVID